jgi:hypothetical protein
MNVEIGIEAAQFPEKEYIIGIFIAVQRPLILNTTRFHETFPFTMSDIFAPQ